jgi:hypothetical protein
VSRQWPAIAGVVLAGLALGVWLSASHGLRDRLLGQSPSTEQVIGPRDCNPAMRPCAVDLGDGQLLLRFDRPPRPLKPFVVELQLLGEWSELPPPVVLSFQMQGMEMGLNRFALEQMADRRWRGEVTLPVCSSGRRDWLVDVIIEGERPQVVQFGFTLGSEE